MGKDLFSIDIQLQYVTYYIIMLNSSASYTFNKFVTALLVYLPLLQYSILASPILKLFVSSPGINEIANYTWNVNLQQNLTNLNCVDQNKTCSTILQFPSDVVFNQSNLTRVFISDVEMTNLSFIDDRTIYLDLNGSYSDIISFLVSYVKNPYYEVVGNFFFSIFSMGQYQNTTGSFTFQPGIIKDCYLQFTGLTNQKNSTATLSFKTTNPIPDDENNTVVFSLNYGISSANITGNNITCSVNVSNDSFFSQPVVATNRSNQSFLCVFPNLNLTSNSSVILTLNNVSTPNYTNNYITSQFVLATSDGKYNYDSTKSCFGQNLPAETQYATFQNIETQIVNSQCKSPIIKTDNIINIPFSQFDVLLLYAMDVKIISVSNISFSRLLTPNNITMFVQKTFTNGSENNFTGKGENFTFINNITRTESDYAIFNMTNTIIQLLPSAIQQQFLFKFFSNSSNIFQGYLDIRVRLSATPAPFNPGEFNVSCSDFRIGYSSDYTFDIKISQPLGNRSFVLLYLPKQVNISGAALDVNLCSNYSCTFVNNTGNRNRIRIDLNLSTPTIVNQTITITIKNMTNPSNPTINYFFGVQTYYNQSNDTSMVQNGINATIKNFTSRDMNISISNNIPYTVSQKNALMKFIYYPGVPLPNGLTITITFNSTFNNSLIFKNMSHSQTSNQTLITVKNNSSNQSVFKLTLLQQIKEDSNVTITFQFTAPSKKSTYPVTDSIVASLNNNVFEELQQMLFIFIGSAVNQKFYLTPAVPMAGAITTYTINFFTNVEHPDQFFLKVIYPYPNVDVTINNSCNSPCTNIINGEGYYIWLNVTKSIKSNNYAINFSSVRNPNQTGLSELFKFETYDSIENGSQMIFGQANAMITIPNSLTANFSNSSFYYKNNSDPVNFNVSFFNTLQQNYSLRVFFDYRTYSIKPNTQPICTRENIAQHLQCQIDENMSTSYTLVIKIDIPTNSTKSINVSIIGLTSSTTTYYTQKIQVPVRSYNSSDYLMDEGFMTYTLSCQSLINVCRTCQIASQKCTSCYPGYYLLNSTRCVTSCSNESTYQFFSNQSAINLTNITCVACKINCSTCISQKQCLSCPQNFILYEDGTCQQGCLNKHYIENISSTLQMCVQCWDPQCIKCQNGGSASCTDCGNFVTKDGKCFNSCDISSYLDHGKCYLCNVACSGCYGNLSSNCIKCKPGFFNQTDNCTNQCPDGKVVLSTDQGCGCAEQCQTCSGISTNCTSCNTTNQFLYHYRCIGQCPNHTYIKSKTCYDCNQGCLNCSYGECYECIQGYNVYETKCYSDCSTIGYGYIEYQGKCIKCPEGCSMCNGQDRMCTLCLTKYSLLNGTCILTCQLENNCPKEVVAKLPLPGSISAFGWILTLVVFKLFIVKKLYFPYSFMFVGCIIQFVLIIFVLISQNTLIKNQLAQSTSRLLQSMPNSSHHQVIVVGLLATTLALNYIENFVFFFLFCRYMRKYIPDRQIDRISNYLVLIVGTLTNFRFSLVAYSKLFPKPNIMIENQSKLTPIHYMCIASIFSTILPLSAAGILIYNQIVLTNLFMLGIDLLVIVLLELIFTIWIVSVDKDENYFEFTKKYSKEQFNHSKIGIDDKMDQNYSKVSLNPNTTIIQNFPIQQEQIDQQILIEKFKNKKSDINVQNNKPNSEINFQNSKSDVENQPLPTIPAKLGKNNLDVIPIRSRNQVAPDTDGLGPQLTKGIVHQLTEGNGHQLTQDDRDTCLQNRILKAETQSDQKTRKYNKIRVESKTEMKKAKNCEESKKMKKIQQSPKKQPQLEQFQCNIKSKISESPNNFSKEKKSTKPKTKKLQLHADSEIAPKFNQNNKNKQSSIKQQAGSECLQQPCLDNISHSTYKQANSDYLKKEKKPTKMKTQRSTMIIPSSMKKKAQYGVYQSQKDNSQIDQVDFTSLIKTKIIQKNKDNKLIENQVTSSNDNLVQEQFSPSWFNIQNQRFDVDQNSDS